MNFNTDNLDYNGLYESDNSIFYHKTCLYNSIFYHKTPLYNVSIQPLFWRFEQ